MNCRYWFDSPTRNILLFCFRRFIFEVNYEFCSSLEKISILYRAVMTTLYRDKKINQSIGIFSPNKNKINKFVNNYPGCTDKYKLVLDKCFERFIIKNNNI